ncbi:outer membrane lipoprotein carrier protein LolA [Flavitalea sp. BT771]|uniref:LolA family protein n=1 Tax=Flavitalea sp. BT771 TaxID=3063329 RepID=UPI0026E24363|nr:outer membrane lipoprotein carrier protein LolA [Flavitalea sp. BT771]MDO6429889.1 outer membrane lipoprotein carrier protein LolA [Flavitalea sp. BT771]MDV6217983.1 outer membrane lipoprotein carrier protein LolA [Flavitalea sp. BT771]
MRSNTKKFIVSILLSGVFLMGKAQNNSLGKNDPEAKKVLDGLSAKLKSYKAVQSNFTLKVEDAKGKLQGTKSGIVYVKGSRYHISITGQEVFSDGKDVWTYDKSSNEVTITKSDPSVATISPEKFFTNFYDKDFLYKLNGEAKVGGRVVQEIELTPVDKTKSFYKALLYIDKAQHSLVSVKWFDKGGNHYTLDTSKLNGNAPLTDAQLAFNKAKYPGVEEVDLRN